MLFFEMYMGLNNIIKNRDRENKIKNEIEKQKNKDRPKIKSFNSRDCRSLS